MTDAYPVPGAEIIEPVTADSSEPERASAGASSERRPLRILLIAFRFPPQVGGGVHRPIRLAKYWSRNGEKVAVLTTTADPGAPQDVSLLRTIPDAVHIEQVPDLGVPAVLQRWRNRLGTAGVRGKVARALGYLQGLIQQLSLPDKHAGWILPAVIGGMRFSRGFVPDVILPTGPPFTSFVVGALLSALLRKPLVLDYRDAWMGSFVDGQRTWLERRLDPMVERWVLGRADSVVAAHRSVLRDLPRLRPEGVRRPFWVPNGYDVDDFAPDQSPDTASFSITYAGSLLGRRDPRTFFSVLDRLLRSGRMDPARVRVRIAGERGDRLRELAGSFNALATVLENHGYLSHHESIALLQTSTVNLIVVRDVEVRNRHSPGKVYEVFYIARPVLLLAPEGVTVQLAHHVGGTQVAHPQDAVRMEVALLALYDAWCRGDVPDAPDRARLRFYDRRHQAARYRCLLARVVVGVEPAASRRASIAG